MNIPLSDRLAACAEFVPQGSRVADIGCDHGYLSLHLLQAGIASHIFAADINEGPLDSAKRNAEKFGFSDKIQFFLSDGVKNVPRDFDCLVCAGMGGDTMVSILQAAPWLQKPGITLVLQCQSKTPFLRQYLSDSGWAIRREAIIRDGRFLYTVMEANFDPQAPRLRPAECHFPPALRATENPLLREYYDYICQGLAIIDQHRPTPENTALLNELRAME